MGTWIDLQKARHRGDLASGDARRPSPDRLKARALEGAALVGRLRGAAPTRADAEAAMSIAAGAANLLRLDLDALAPDPAGATPDWASLAGCAGALADAAEKIDHLEDFRPIAVSATRDLARWGLAASAAA